MEVCLTHHALYLQLWHMIGMVDIEMAEWSKTLWNDVNVEEMEDGTKGFYKQMRALDKVTKTSNAYVELEKKVKGFLTHMIKLSEEDFETLEDHQLQIQNMMGSRYLATFEEQVTKWQHDLASVADVVGLMSEIQRTWAYLETLQDGGDLHSHCGRGQ